jgi:hypothetical protein
MPTIQTVQHILAVQRARHEDQARRALGRKCLAPYQTLVEQASCRPMHEVMAGVTETLRTRRTQERLLVRAVARQSDPVTQTCLDALMDATLQLG